MSIDGTTYAAIADTLKETYAPMLTEQFPNEAITYNTIESSNRKPSGSGYVGSIVINNPMGSGARGDGQILPDPLPGTYDKFTINPKLNYGVLRTTGLAIEASKGNAAAFAEALGNEVMGAYNGLKTDLNRQCLGDGFGKLATLSAVSDTLSTSTTWTATCDNDTGLRYLQEGMVVDPYQGAAIDQSACSSRILYLNPTTRVITFEKNDSTYLANHPIVAARSYSISAATMASGTQLVRQGARLASWATTDTPYEITGLEGIFDDGTNLATFEGITVASQPRWAANVMGNSGVGRELTLDLMLAACDMSSTRGGKKVNVIRMGLGQRRKYASLLVGDVRFAPGNLQGGFERLLFSAGDGSIEIIVDPVMAPNVMYFEPKGVVKKYELTPLGWGGADGQQMLRRQGYDSYDQMLRIFTNLGCEQRNCLTKLADLVEPAQGSW